MNYRTLGRTDAKVSELCLGIMTFGQQVGEADAHAQLDFAAGHGVNFVDTAEMYPFPAKPETQGDSERILGRWMSRRRNRSEMVVATKVSGPGDGWLGWIRDGNTRLERSNIEAAVDCSLERLGSDYIDLYQLHWPDRKTNFFGRLGYTHELRPDEISVLDTLEVLGDLVKAGKLRHIGVSNETAWGTLMFCTLAEQHGLPRVVSIQNPYSLLNRTFEINLAEVAHREDVGLLAYSPLAFGVLTGKYLDGNRPPGSRLALFPQYARYLTEPGLSAARAYVELAREHGITPAQLAIGYVTSRPFLTSTIITATSLAQLEEDVRSVEIPLPDALLQAVEAIHERRPNPCP